MPVQKCGVLFTLDEETAMVTATGIAFVFVCLFDLEVTDIPGGLSLLPSFQPILFLS